MMTARIEPRVRASARCAAIRSAASIPAASVAGSGPPTLARASTRAAPRIASQVQAMSAGPT